MRKNRLGMKAMIGLLFLALILVLCTCFSVSIQYLREKMEEYGRIAFSYARTAAEYIDGDKVLSYLEAEQEDDYYRRIQDFLNALQKQTDLKYYYVFVPCEYDLIYIWDAEHEAGACSLGYHESYMEGGKEAVERIYRPNPPEKILITDDEAYGFIASAFYPVFNSGGDPVAVVGVDLSMPEIKKALGHFLCIIVYNVAGVILLSMFFFYAFIRRNIIMPVRQLNEAAKAMVSNLEQEVFPFVDIRTDDEIEELAGSFGQMNVELRDYIGRLSQVTAEKERIGAELDVAAHIQAAMLPCIFPAFPERKELDIYAIMEPAKEVGGDFYDFFMLDREHLAIVMADVSGKGVPAALFMVIGKTLIKDHTRPEEDLGDVFTRVNELLCESNDEGLFITAFEGVLNLVTGEFHFVNAGHETPFLCKKEGTYMPFSIRTGFVLAGMEGIRYQADRIWLEPGDKFFQYTDGVTEAANGKNELYGMGRLTETLQKNAQKMPMELLLAVKKNISDFVEGAPQSDDITMLCVEYKERMQVDIR